MCGRFALDEKVNDLIGTFVRDGGEPGDWLPDGWQPPVPAEWVPNWNIRPTDQIAIILESQKPDSPRTRRFETAYWSLIPSWAKERRQKFPTFNARAESALEKPMFKAAAASRRAIIPANGYFEWQTVGSTKTPYFIHPGDDELLGFAGLYSWWIDPALPDDAPDRWVLSATILTADTVETLAHIHDRNPVMLPQELWEQWIDPTLTGTPELFADAIAASRAVASELEFTRVGPVTGNGPELLLPA